MLQTSNVFADTWETFDDLNDVIFYCVDTPIFECESHDEIDIIKVELYEDNIILSLADTPKVYDYTLDLDMFISIYLGFIPFIFTVDLNTYVTISVTSLDYNHTFEILDYGINETVLELSTTIVSFTANQTGFFEITSNNCPYLGYMRVEESLADPYFYAAGVNWENKTQSMTKTVGYYGQQMNKVITSIYDVDGQLIDEKIENNIITLVGNQLTFPVPLYDKIPNTEPYEIWGEAIYFIISEMPRDYYEDCACKTYTMEAVTAPGFTLGIVFSGLATISFIFIAKKRKK